MPLRIHPRVPENAPGDFYVEAGHCWFCTAAPNEASSLMHIPRDASESCYFKRQPRTDEEVEAAIQAICVSEMCAVRYGGADEKILQRLWENGQGNQCDRAPREPLPSTEQRRPWWTEIAGAKPGDAPPEAMRSWMKEIDERNRRAAE